MLTDNSPRADAYVAAREAERRHELVRQAEAFMWQHAEEPIDLATIAAGVGCSVRKLLYSFKRTHGVGAVSYFKAQRLAAVRAVLMTGETQRTISDIAADYGFWHMGHFGADYKALFGLTPSETRRVASSGAIAGPPERSQIHRRPVRRPGIATTVAVVPRTILRSAGRISFAVF